MKLKQPNHYNFFGIRKFKFPPPHLEYITLSTAYNLEKSIERWINSNLKGRYYLGKTVNAITLLVSRGILIKRKWNGRLYFKKSELDCLIDLPF